MPNGADCSTAEEPVATTAAVAAGGASAPDGSSDPDRQQRPRSTAATGHPLDGEGELLEPTSGDAALPRDMEGDVTSRQDLDLTRPNGAIRLTDEVPTYTRFDVGLGWRHPDSRISIDGFINDIFNTADATTIISTPNLNLRFFNPPRVAGVRIRVDW